MWCLSWLAWELLHLLCTDKINKAKIDNMYSTVGVYTFVVLTTRSTRYSHNITTVNCRARNCQQFFHLHVIWEMAWILCIPYSRKLSREKTFTNFMVLEPPAKVFSLKFVCAILTYVRF